MDSGATEHVCHEINEFVTYEQLVVHKNVMIGDEIIIQAAGVATIKLQAYNGSKWLECSLSNVLYVRKIAVNLFSVMLLWTKGTH